MMLNYIWVGFFLIAVLVAVIRITGYLLSDYFISLAHFFDKSDLNVFSDMLDSTFKMAEKSVTISIYLIGVMTLWLGIMRIGEKGGAIKLITFTVKPLFKKLFPEIPSDHPAIGSMIMNLCATMLGMENAATPMGLKAMKELQEINVNKQIASNAQIMYFIMVVTGFMLLPINIIALRAANGVNDPTDILIPVVITTLITTIVGIFLVALIQKINIFNKIILAYLIFFILFISAIFYALFHINHQLFNNFSRHTSAIVIIMLIVFFIFLGLKRKLNVYETFIDGAKEGFNSAIKIIPYLVAMLVAIGVFRASGAMDLIIKGFVYLFNFMGVNTDFTQALPVALMKPLSGNGARGLMLEIMQHTGVNSFAGKLASIFQGSTDTTFYVLALYFGSINIKNTRYALGCALITDLLGIIISILLSYLFFK